MSLSHFIYHRPGSAADATRLLEDPDALPMGGGTDLLVLIKEQLAHPKSVVDLRGIPDSRSVQPTGDGGLRIGAGACVADLASHDVVCSRFPALASACESVGTTALRHMGTLGRELGSRARESRIDAHIQR